MTTYQRFNVLERAKKNTVKPRLAAQVTTPVKEIIEAVEATFGIPQDVFCVRTRKKEVITSRYAFYLAAWTSTNLTLGTIATTCGKFDHSTVLHGIEAMKDWYLVDKNLRAQIDELALRVNNHVFYQILHEIL
jgi:chromosomal replication initiation ATPase DnaA